MDMAKLGQLYLQKGEWNGQRIFAASYTDEAWKPGPGKTYGLHWWIGTSRFVRGAPFVYAEGFKGQLIYVVPTHDAVVVVSASLPSAEVGAVATIVVKALAESVAYGADRTGHPAQERLKAQEAAGFNGLIRVNQTVRDEPRRL
jgi:CubicO group peptidase (beta-lactamase class C family)